MNFVGLEELVADIRTLEYTSNSYALGKGLHCEVSPGEIFVYMMIVMNSGINLT